MHRLCSEKGETTQIKYLFLKMEFLRKDEAFNGLYSLWSKQNVIDFKTFEDFVEISFLKH